DLLPGVDRQGVVGVVVVGDLAAFDPGEVAAGGGVELAELLPGLVVGEGRQAEHHVRRPLLIVGGLLQEAGEALQPARLALLVLGRRREARPLVAVLELRDALLALTLEDGLDPLLLVVRRALVVLRVLLELVELLLLGRRELLAAADRLRQRRRRREE